MRLDLLDQAQRLKIGDNALARLEAIKPTIGLRNILIQRAVLGSRSARWTSAG
jgi:hypothetical protein